jgi:hypothetical protein
MTRHINRYPWQARTHTYYMDATGGSDSNRGTAPDLAWKTMAKVNNIATFKPGDRILLKRGEAFSNTSLNLVSSGKPGRPILISNYGSGAKPIQTGGTGSSGFFSVTSSWFTLDGLELRTGTTRVFEIQGGCGISVLNCDLIGGGLQSGLLAYGNNIRDLFIIGNTINGFVAGAGIEVAAGALSVGPVHVIIRGNICNYNGADAGHHGIYVRYVTKGSLAQNSCAYNVGSGIKVRLQCSDICVEQNVCNSNGNNGFETNLLDAGCNVVFRNNIAQGNLNNALLSNTSIGTSWYHNSFIHAAYRNVDFYDAASISNVFKNNLVLQNALVSLARPLRITAEAQAASNMFNYNDWAYLNGDGKPFNDAGTTKTLAEWQTLVGTPDLNSIVTDPVLVDVTLRASTTVDADSAAGQPVLNVADTTSFVVGEYVSIGIGTARVESQRIASIQAGVSLTMTINLANAHTGAQADVVNSLICADLHIQTTSPCKNTGATGLGVLTDYDSIVRDATPDMGAFEYV